MTKPCLTCIEDSNDETEYEIPKWSQLMGNYSALPSVLNCEEKYNANKVQLCMHSIHSNFLFYI